MHRRRLIFASAALVASLRAGANEAVSLAFAAAHKNDSVALASALQRGVNPNARNDEGASLLYVATGPKGGIAAVQLLLSVGANPDAGHGKYTPLMNAASWVNLEAVNALLEAGADP